MFKLETHLHTKYSSSCGKLDAETILRGYREAGYSGIVVTDHYSRKLFAVLHAEHYSLQDKWQMFLDGYNRLKEMAPNYGIRIYRGVEIRFDENDNDYLLYNFPDELIYDGEEVFPLGIAGFAPRYRRTDAVLFQAHPFRDTCTPAPAWCLDGVEVRNCHPRQKNHNELAQQYAQEHQLRRLCGSDCHQLPDIAGGGILVERLPEDDAELAVMLRAGEYTLIEK